MVIIFLPQSHCNPSPIKRKWKCESERIIPIRWNETHYTQWFLQNPLGFVKTNKSNCTNRSVIGCRNRQQIHMGLNLVQLIIEDFTLTRCRAARSAVSPTNSTRALPTSPPAFPFPYSFLTHILFLQNPCMKPFSTQFSSPRNGIPNLPPFFIPNLPYRISLLMVGGN